MAKQVGPLLFTGTINGLIFYELNGKYYSRSKGSYKSAKHMRRNPKYKRTMENADRFGMASKLVREVYYQYLPKAMRKQGVYGKLTGKVRDWLQEGKSREEAQALLIEHCQSLYNAVNQPMNNKQGTIGYEQVATNTMVLSIPLNEQRSPINAQPKAKQARYLSRWKVKKNGHLYIPNLPVIVPLIYQT
jgi:hypothetical protein